MTTRLHIGSVLRSTKNQQEYDSYLKHIPKEYCTFCHPKNPHMGKTVGTSTYFYVAMNRFPYTAWDNFVVAEHLLLIPKRHIETIGEFTTEERAEYLDIVCKYEKNGYNTYARAPIQSAKTIPHQHTHFIKITPNKIKAMVYVEHPKKLFKRHK